MVILCVCVCVPNVMGVNSLCAFHLAVMGFSFKAVANKSRRGHPQLARGAQQRQGKTK